MRYENIRLRLFIVKFKVFVCILKFVERDGSGVNSSSAVAAAAAGDANTKE